MMLKKDYLTGLILLFFILFSGIVIPTYSQAPPIPTFNESYKVKVGDSMTYEYTIVQSSIKNLPGDFWENDVVLTNNTPVYFNTTKGLQFTVKVVNKYSPNNISVEEIYNVPKIGVLVSKPSIIQGSYGIPAYNTYLIPAFDNTSMVNNYKTYLLDHLTGATINQVSYVISGNYFIENIKSTSGLTTTSFKWNWKTGWMDQWELKEAYSNGSIYGWEKIQNINDISSGFSINSNLVIEIAGILAIPAIFVIGAIIGLKIKKRPR